MLYNKSMSKDGNKINDKLLVGFVRAMEKAYGSWKYLAGRSFVAGIFTGLGATVGVAIVLLIIGYILKWLGVIPVVGDFFKQLNQFISSSLPGN